MLGLGSLVPRVLGVFHIGPEFLADRMSAESQASQREPKLAPCLHPHWCRLYMESFLYCLDSRVTRRASTLVGYPLAIHCAVESVIPHSLLRIYAKTDALANLPKVHIWREVTNRMAFDSVSKEWLEARKSESSGFPHVYLSKKRRIEVKVCM